MQFVVMYSDHVNDRLTIIRMINGERKRRQESAVMKTFFSLSNVQTTVILSIQEQYIRVRTCSLEESLSVKYFKIRYQSAWFKQILKLENNLRQADTIFRSVGSTYNTYNTDTRKSIYHNKFNTPDRDYVIIYVVKSS